MRRTDIVALSVVCILGCASSKPPEMSQLQMREFQTRVFDTDKTKAVLKACIDTLQDQGFIIRNAVADLGVLNAFKQIDVSSSSEAFWNSFFFGSNARWKKNSEQEVSINVSEFGNKTKVRVNWILKIIDNKGAPVDTKPIYEEKYYQEFFAKVDKAVFIQQEKL